MVDAWHQKISTQSTFKSVILCKPKELQPQSSLSEIKIFMGIAS